ncbi:hypothetical protein ASPWEDRAFT_703168 [Aspergillus wentii DTO 134E9]|uniref:Uncharacterized protein n=1 Tax=Aspergillus wentii DTO 134E9 TaxID=1073089 RepID=A0A1L9R5Q5_ASPWE|nr:uncharacterized protein ASPWEDRAFT_703168 [Aspergillus wentii DTO 134E9]OJJ30249.1 hypothetical protein ASPWEDRAFT_703168 [Aspergillus wentii DTO 134E9]
MSRLYQDKQLKGITKKKNETRNKKEKECGREEKKKRWRDRRRKNLDLRGGLFSYFFFFFLAPFAPRSHVGSASVLCARLRSLQCIHSSFHGPGFNRLFTFFFFSALSQVKKKLNSSVEEKVHITYMFSLIANVIYKSLIQ